MAEPIHEERDFIVPVASFLIVYSIAVHVIVCLSGYYTTPENIMDGGRYRSFLEQFNWNLYPLFYVIGAAATHASWAPFLAVWKQLVASKIVRADSGAGDDEVVGAILRYLKYWRAACVALAVALACLLNYFAFKDDVWDMYAAKSYEEQMRRGCKEPDLFSRWLISCDPATGDCAQKVCIQTKCAPYARTNECAAGTPPAKVPRGQIVIAVVVYAQQFFLVILASLFFLQLLVHPLVFHFLERTGAGKEYALRIELAAGSWAKEFGLEHWNHALNNVYWFLSIGLLIPIVSRMSQPDGGMNLGQNLIRFGVAMLVLLPMIVTIISRQGKLPAVWKRLNEQRDVAEAWKDYHEQRLWPLDKNWSSKIGIIVALALASFLLGAEILKITGL